MVKSRSHDFQKVSLKWSIVSNFARNTYIVNHYDLSVYPMTFDLGCIERLNQGHWVLIGLCIIDMYY